MYRWGLAVLVALSCSAVAKEQSYSPPRLDSGQPDMQGVWVASNGTPLQRPAGFSTLVIDEAQAAQLLASVSARFEDRSTPTEPTEYFDDHSIERVRGQLRSSIIVLAGSVCGSIGSKFLRISGIGRACVPETGRRR